jgi:hypothetical protein
MLSAGASNELRPGLISLELSGASASVTLTQGAINLWLGRNVDKILLARILTIISRVDSTTEYEKEIICEFDEINDFENHGFILTSYAKKGDKYKSIFIVPFSNPRALKRLAESILEELKREDLRLTLYWRGDRTRLNIIFDDLSRLKYFNICNATYKEDQV